MSHPINNNDPIFNLIKSRRTCYQFLDTAVTTQQIETCLQAAVFAPNHKLTQPWRFWIVGDEVRKKLSHIYADNRASKKQANTEDDCYQCFYDLAVEKFAKIPQVILVGQVKAKDSVTLKEDYAACACAIQNFQLMAWQESIGVQWSTGPILQDPRTFQLLDISANDIELIGALYIGNIDDSITPKTGAKRKPLNEVVFETA